MLSPFSFGGFYIDEIRIDIAKRERNFPNHLATETTESHSRRAEFYSLSVNSVSSVAAY